MVRKERKKMLPLILFDRPIPINFEWNEQPVFVKKVVASNKLKLPHPLRYFATYISVLFPQKTGNRPKIQAIKTSIIVA
jgi:hypothetical protein